MAVSGERLLRVIGRVLVHIKQDEALALIPQVQPEAEAGKAGLPGDTGKTPDGQGLSSGAEGIMDYKGDFEID
jgi:hypothetical protein